MPQKLKRLGKPMVGTGPRGFTEWVQPLMPKFLLGCCDCGLVHEMQFRVVEDGRRKRVQFRARRAERYTSRRRRQIGKAA